MFRRIPPAWSLILIFGLLGPGCASTLTDEDGNRIEFIGMQDYDQNSEAEGAAYVVDAMSVRTPMVSRPDWRPMAFYFKHCSRVNDTPYMKKVEFECSGPY